MQKMLRLGMFTVAAAATALAASDPPQQIHLAYGTPTWGSMTVSWQTLNLTSTSVVKYSTDGSLNKTAIGSPPTTYLYTYDHHVTLSGLSPSTTYFYVCGDGAAGYSPVMNFTTAPAPGTEFPFTLAVFADMGNWNSNNTFLDLFRIAPQIDAILQVGDISYADDSFLHDPLAFGYETVWNTYMNHIQTVSAYKPLMTAPGNHEAECHSPVCFLDATLRTATANFTAYNHRFRMPSAGSNGTMNMWYSFDVGSLHFVQISAETDYPNAPNDDYASKNGGFGNQMGWLQADLAAAAARRAAGEVSWIIVSGHRPLYSASNVDATTFAPTGSAATMQAAFEPLFQEYGVDVYFSGHVHGTEAQWPVFNTTSVFKSFTNPPHTTYLVVGGAGCDEGLTDYSGVPAGLPWSVFFDGTNYGLTVATFQDKDTMNWQFRRATDGTVLQNITLVRQH